MYYKKSKHVYRVNKLKMTIQIQWSSSYWTIFNNLYYKKIIVEILNAYDLFILNMVLLYIIPESETIYRMII